MLVERRRIAQLANWRVGSQLRVMMMMRIGGQQRVALLQGERGALVALLIALHCACVPVWKFEPHELLLLQTDRLTRRGG